MVCIWLCQTYQAVSINLGQLLFEEVLAFGRLGEDLNRELEVCSGYVTAVD
jgi:hypothetical protein